MTDAWDDDREELDEAERDETTDKPNLLGHDPVLGPSDPEADRHGDDLTRVDEDQLGENQPG